MDSRDGYMGGRDRMPRGIMMLVGVMLYGVLVVLFSASPWFSTDCAKTSGL